MAESSAPGRSRRVQNLLNAYYHLDDDEKEPEEKAKKFNVDAIDAPGFDGDRWVHKLLAESNVNSLVRHVADLDSDITNLDSDMQMLVYENYSKFIRATDTIRSLKDTLDENWHSRFQTLKNNLGNMNGLQEDISKHLGPRARVIEKLLLERTLLRKALHLFQVPQILRTCLEEEKYGQAAATYCQCIGFLRKNQHILPFKEAFTAVEECMQQLGKKLEQKLSSSTLELDEAINCAITLQELNHRDHALILNDFATGRLAALREVYKGLDTPGAGLRALTTKCLTYFIPVLMNTVEGVKKIRADEKFLKKFVEEATSILLQGIINFRDERPTSPVLRSCLDSFRDACVRLHEEFPEILDKLFADFFKRMVETSVESAFDATLVHLVHHFTDLHAQCLTFSKDDVLDKIGSSEHAMLVDGCLALTEARPLLDIVSADEKVRLVGILLTRMETFFHTFNDALHAYSGKWFAQACPERVRPMKELSWNPSFCLALVRIGRHLEVRGVAKLYSVAEDFFGTLPKSAVATETLTQNSRAAAQACMDYLVLTEATRFSHLLRNSVEENNYSSEPSAPQPVCGVLLKEIHQFDSIVSKVLGDPRRPRADRRNRLRKNLEVQQMLAKSVQTFTTIPFNRNGALFGLLKIIIKSLGLYVREELFTNEGVQQIQLDVAFLNDMFRDFVELDDVNILDGMCIEIISACSQRCHSTDPKLLEDSVIENLVDEYKAKFEY